LGPHSNASERDSSSTPARAALVCAIPGKPRPTTAITFTIEPPSPSSIGTPNTCVMFQVPVRFVSMTAFQPFGL
jgi:hypothetical protein